MQLVLKSTEICNVRYVLESCIIIVRPRGGGGPRGEKLPQFLRTLQK